MSSDQTGRDDRGGKNGPPNIADAEEQLRQLVDTALDEALAAAAAAAHLSASLADAGAARAFSPQP